MENIQKIVTDELNHSVTSQGSYFEGYNL